MSEYRTVVHDLYSVAVGASDWPIFLESFAGCTGSVWSGIIRLDGDLIHVAAAHENYRQQLYNRAETWAGRHETGSLSPLDTLGYSAIRLVPHVKLSPTAQPVGEFLEFGIETPCKRRILLVSHHTGQLTHVGCRTKFEKKFCEHIAFSHLLAGEMAAKSKKSVLEILEIFGFPAAILDFGRQITLQNKHFARLCPGYFSLRSSKLEAKNADVDSAIRRAVTKPIRFGHTRVVGMPGRGSKMPHIVYLTPYANWENNVLTDPYALIVAVPVTRRPAPPLEILSELFGLTKAEARVAQLIVDGHPPRSAAAKLGLANETVRTALKRVLSKTGQRRQADLVGLLSTIGMSAPGHTLGDS